MAADDWAARYVVGVHHTGLYVKSLAESLPFYREVLGMEVDFERIAPGRHIVMLKGGAGRLELLEISPVETTDRRAPGLRHVAYEVTDLAAACAELSEQGTEFLDPLLPTARGAFFRAPDGTFIELIEPNRPIPEP
jgi:catechol 2,3-dioxygenase-like lactoylglutathione lyase family enzyme